MHDRADDGRLPDELAPPPMRRHVLLRPLQKFGVPLLAIVPILALAGVVGDQRSRASARSALLDLQVEYPARIRLQGFGALAVAVTNTGHRTLDTLRVAIDSAYLAHFSQIAFTPGASEMNTVELTNVIPGETRQVLVAMRADEPWRHRGTVSATTGAADSAHVAFATFVFP